MGFLPSDSSRAIAWLTVAGVLVVGLTDWFQGQAPQGVIDLGDAGGLALFIACSLGVAAAAEFVTDRQLDEPAFVRWAVVVGLAATASLVADPTYAVMLLAVPIVHIARGWPEPQRRYAIVVIFVVAVVLISLEDQSWARNNLETAMVQFLALLITSMLGHALGRLDQAAVREADAARRDEREQLAAELHDSVGHNLLATSIQLRNAQALWDADTEGAHRSVELAKRAVDDALVDTRIAVDSVRSRSDRFSLAAALPELIERSASPSLDVELTLEGPVDSVEQLTQITLYRVAQEALTNAVRHADASAISVRHASHSAETVLTIADDGRGFDAAADATHLGLRGLEERLHRIGGRLDVTSSPATGTTVTATVGAAS